MFDLTHTNYCKGGKDKDNEMDRTCKTNGKYEKFVENIFWKTKLYGETCAQIGA